MARKSGNKGKASGFKLTNKKTNKLAKRGQLDHQKKKRKESLKARKLAEISKARQTAINIKPSGNEEPVVEDEGYFEDANVNFAKSLLRDGDGRQKKKRKNNNEIEALFGMNSKRAKQWTGDDSTPLLPIKDKNKLIQRSLPAESPASDIAGEDKPEVEENVEVSKPLPEVSVVDLFATRAQKLQNRQTAIASMSCAIVENPEENLKKLRTLKEFWDEKDPDIRMGNRKLLLLSLTEIYKDILPDYNIRVASQAEKQQAASKDTKQLRHYEENLLHNYKLYLQMLEECIGKAGDKKQRETADEKTKEFRLLAVRCMTQVFVKRPTFNFSKNVINVLIPLLAVHNHQILKTICTAVQQVFKDDKKGETSLEIVRCICRTVKARNFQVSPMVMNTFLALRIKEINTEEEKQKKLTHKEKMKQWSRKERKLDKKRKELNKQLEEAAVELNRSKILQARTDTITAIFTLYFIILKKAQDSALLSPVLAGLAKFAHLINVDFFDDLFKVFGEILQLEILNIADVLNITRTAFTILSGQGEALNIDPQRFYTQLYKVLPQLATGEGSACIENIPEIFKLMFIDRKKKVTNARVLAYTKRLVSVSIHLEGEPALVVLTVVRNLFSTFPYTDVLLDTECIGSGMYRPDIDEPEYCNAHNSTVLYELHLLTHHSEDAVRQCAKLLLKNSPEHQKTAKTRCMLCVQSPDELIDEIQQQNLATSHTAGQKQKRKAVNTEAVKLKQSYSTIE